MLNFVHHSGQPINVEGRSSLQISKGHAVYTPNGKAVNDQVMEALKISGPLPPNNNLGGGIAIALQKTLHLSAMPPRLRHRYCGSKKDTPDSPVV